MAGVEIGILVRPLQLKLDAHSIDLKTPRRATSTKRTSTADKRNNMSASTAAPTPASPATETPSQSQPAQRETTSIDVFYS